MKLNFNIKTSQADPYVIKANNLYFMYVTGVEGVRLFSSSDRLNWKDEGICLTLENHRDFWAPSVIEIGDTFYMYVSCVTNDSKDVHEQAIFVATSKTPYGPFVKHNDLILPFSIDAHVVKSGEELYIFYSTNDYKADRPGTLIMVDKMISPFEVSNNPKVVVRPTLDEEIFMKNRFNDGKDWHTLEGAFYLRKGNFHYLIYSGNCFENENYYLGYAVAEGDTNELTNLTFKKYPNETTYAPLIRKNDVEEGTGHCSVLEDDGNYYVYYHGRDYGTNIPKTDHRTARIAEIKLDNGQIQIIKR